MRSPTRRSPTAPPHGPTTGAARHDRPNGRTYAGVPTARHGRAPADLKFTGTRLRDNVEQADGQWRPQAFAWGYADNFSTVDRIGTTNRLRISDAVTADGSPANLQQIDFIKVQTA